MQACRENVIEFPVGDCLEVTNAERLSAIEQRLDDIEKKPLGQVRSGVAFIKRHWGWSITVGLAAATVIVTIIGIWYPASKAHEAEDFSLRVDARIGNKIGNQLSGLDTKVTKIQTSLDDLKPYIESLVRRDFERTAKLPPDELKNELRDVQHLAPVARDQATLLNPVTVNRVADKLLALQSRPSDFWPTASALINYRSFLGAPEEYEKTPPTCNTLPPEEPKLLIQHPNGSFEEVPNPHYS